MALEAVATIASAWGTFHSGDPVPVEGDVVPDGDGPGIPVPVRDAWLAAGIIAEVVIPAPEGPVETAAAPARERAVSPRGRKG